VIASGQALSLALFLFILLPAHAPFVSTKGFEYYADLRLAILTGGMTWLFAYDTGFARTIFGNRAAVAIGAWSFSLYLLHTPILQLSAHWLAPVIGPTSAGLIGVAASIFSSYLSFKILEAPLRSTIRGRISRFLDQRSGIVRNLDRVFVRPFFPQRDIVQ
jgi:peptidoglycan/LPS O-acetylase OafA/YrhL